MTGRLHTLPDETNENFLNEPSESSSLDLPFFTQIEQKKRQENNVIQRGKQWSPERIHMKEVSRVLYKTTIERSPMRELPNF